MSAVSDLLILTSAFASDLLILISAFECQHLDGILKLVREKGGMLTIS